MPTTIRNINRIQFDFWALKGYSGFQQASLSHIYIFIYLNTRIPRYNFNSTVYNTSVHQFFYIVCKYWHLKTQMQNIHIRLLNVLDFI